MRARWKTLGFASAFAAYSFCANAQTFSWNWTGFYVGADAGFISSRSLSSTQATVPVPSSSSYLTAAPPFTNTLPIFNITGVDTLSTRGTQLGVHAGYNWQLKPLAVGVEIDFSEFRTRGVRDTAYPLCITGCPSVSGVSFPTGIVSQLHSETSTDWLFTVRPRVGWVYSVLYGYITGGAAFTTINASTLYTDSANTRGFVSTSQSKAGWVIGAGLEVAIAPRWTLRAEYLRVEFSGVTGASRIVNGALFNPINFSADHKSDMVRVGVSHKFQWWWEEPPPPVAPGPVVVTKD